MDIRFYELANKCHKERIKQERRNQNTLDYKARMEYAQYYAWCKANEKNENAIQSFIKYEKQINRQIDFWVKKRISELFFNYEYRYDIDSNRWKRVKEG